MSDNPLRTLTNEEMASRLRGLADLVGSCDRPVRIRIGATLRWSDAPDFSTPILSFVDFTNTLAMFTTKEIIKKVQAQGDDPDAARIRGVLEGILSKFEEAGIESRERVK